MVGHKSRCRESALWLELVTTYCDYSRTLCQVIRKQKRFFIWWVWEVGVVARRLYEDVVGIRGDVEPDLAAELTSGDRSFLLFGGKKSSQSYEIHGINLISWTE
jgi:hypothetical protein